MQWEKQEWQFESFSSLDVLDPNQARRVLKRGSRILANFVFLMEILLDCQVHPASCSEKFETFNTCRHHTGSPSLMVLRYAVKCSMLCEFYNCSKGVVFAFNPCMFSRQRIFATKPTRGPEHCQPSFPFFCACTTTLTKSKPATNMLFSGLYISWCAESFSSPTCVHTFLCKILDLDGFRMFRFLALYNPENN